MTERSSNGAATCFSNLRVSSYSALLFFFFREREKQNSAKEKEKNIINPIRFVSTTSFILEKKMHWLYVNEKQFLQLHYKKKQKNQKQVVFFCRLCACTV